jgi:hypothetical protein
LASIINVQEVTNKLTELKMMQGETGGELSRDALYVFIKEYTGTLMSLNISGSVVPEVLSLDPSCVSNLMALYYDDAK